MYILSGVTLIGVATMPTIRCKSNHYGRIQNIGSK
jgi:hypothetical protein